FLVFFLKEHVLVVADILDVFDVLDIGNVLVGALFGLGVGILERNDLGTGGVILVLGFRLLDLGFLGLLVVLEDLGAARPRRGGGDLLEIGPGIGLAGIGRDDG